MTEFEIIENLQYENSGYLWGKVNMWKRAVKNTEEAIQHIDDPARLNPSLDSLQSQLKTFVTNRDYFQKRYNDNEQTILDLHFQALKDYKR